MARKSKIGNLAQEAQEEAQKAARSKAGGSSVPIPTAGPKGGTMTVYRPKKDGRPWLRKTVYFLPDEWAALENVSADSRSTGAYRSISELVREAVRGHFDLPPDEGSQ